MLLHIHCKRGLRDLYDESNIQHNFRDILPRSLRNALSAGWLSTLNYQHVATGCVASVLQYKYWWSDSAVFIPSSQLSDRNPSLYPGHVLLSSCLAHVTPIDERKKKNPQSYSVALGVINHKGMVPSYSPLVFLKRLIDTASGES